MSINWLNYSLDQNTYKPKMVEDVVSNHNNVIHNLIYEDAKHKSILNAKEGENYIFERQEKTNNTQFFNNGHYIFLQDDKITETTKDNCSYFIDLSKYKINEINSSSDTYIDIPSISVTHKTYNNGILQLKRYEIDLSEWWNNDYENYQINIPDSIANHLLDWYKYNDIIEYDYIRGNATLENRVEYKKRKIKFKNISEEDTLDINY
jgi:hypothetical protein